MTSTKIVLLTGILLVTAFSTATTYGFLSNSQYEIILLTGILLATGLSTAATYGFLSNSQYEIVLLTGMLLAAAFSTATTYGFLGNSQYEIVLLTGILLATGLFTATIYGFLSNSHYMILRYLRFPTLFLSPATIYFIVGLNNGEKLEIVKIIVTCLESFDAQKFAEFLTQIPLFMWLFASLVIWSCIATSLINGYFQQNEYAIQSTSAILRTVDNIFTSFSTVQTNLTLQSSRTYMSVLLFVGIVLLIASVLFLEGKQQWLLAFIAIILAAPGYIRLVCWTIKSCKT
ncbi:hypothetical protein ACHAPF_007348 [Botrytis cinerea]